VEIDADVVMLVEVGGEDSLVSFNRLFLGDRYEPYFVEGNSARGMDLAFLVRRGLPLEAEALSNREREVRLFREGAHRRARFSRDIAELRLCEGDVPRLILLLVHLKSKLSAVGDVAGRSLRTAEADALADFYAQRRSEFPGVPVVVGGDFNAPLGSQELELLARSGLVDFNDVVGTPESQRYTHVHFDMAGNVRAEAIDYLLLSPELRDVVVKEGSFTFWYQGERGTAPPLPSAAVGRYLMPSDHFPVVVTLDLGALDRGPGAAAGLGRGDAKGEEP
ncbi:MAG: endonuclease/exonuclease/phosphatase family protein, partial [Myxococcales bacterium]